MICLHVDMALLHATYICISMHLKICTGKDVESNEDKEHNPCKGEQNKVLGHNCFLQYAQFMNVSISCSYWINFCILHFCLLKRT